MLVVSIQMAEDLAGLSLWLCAEAKSTELVVLSQEQPARLAKGFRSVFSERTDRRSLGFPSRASFALAPKATRIPTNNR
jgi:hypothetical protein